jgi:hypothetical protein
MTVKDARDKLRSSGLTLDLLENQISEYTGFDLEQWQQGRKSVLKGTSYRLRTRLEGTNKKDEDNEIDEDNEDEVEEWDIQDYLEVLEYDEGLFELVALYKLFLSVEATNPSEIVTLDISEFALEDNELSDVIGDAREAFIQAANMYRFLNRYVIDESDRASLVRSILSSLNEDDLIDEVLLPLLPKMGFSNVSRIHHHGPNEW